MPTAIGKPLSRAFDSVFAKYAGRLPVAYLRALAYRESSMNPRGGYPNDPAWGILQVVETLRNSYNQRTGAAIARDQLLDPDTNTKIAADLLNRIVAAYAKHPSPNLKENWTNPEFVKLLTAGWNSGYSEAGGVGKVATYLEQRGIPVTHDNIFKYAAAAGATQWLQLAQRQNWQRSVADLYFAQPDAGKTGGASTLLLAALAVVGGLVIATFMNRG